MLAREKHPSLLRKFVIYGRKFFLYIGPWLQKENFYSGNLLLFRGNYVIKCYKTLLPN